MLSNYYDRFSSCTKRCFSLYCSFVKISLQQYWFTLVPSETKTTITRLHKNNTHTQHKYGRDIFGLGDDDVFSLTLISPEDHTGRAGFHKKVESNLPATNV